MVVVTAWPNGRGERHLWKRLASVGCVHDHDATHALIWKRDCTGPASSYASGSSPEDAGPEMLRNRSRSRDSRRRRSMARLRAVVVIQPPGLGGKPSFGHRRRATAYASWTASTATSISPKTRIRAATDRPEHSRKTASIVAPSTSGSVNPWTCPRTGAPRSVRRCIE
jgi:hypothetical protein